MNESTLSPCNDKHCSPNPTASRRGRRLEVFTIGWNSLEAVVSIASGVFAGSASLIGFGIDSVIESTSGAVLLWRLQDGGEHREQLAQRLVGVCFFALAGYIAIDAGTDLWWRQPPEVSYAGIIIAALSLIVMPILARAKRVIAGEIGSNALASDARQTDLCVYLSAILLVGLGLNALLGWWWADPIAGLAMLPIILLEGSKSWRGEHCC